MNIEYVGECTKYGETESHVIYRYHAFDLDEDLCPEPERVQGGIIKISKSSLAEPEKPAPGKKQCARKRTGKNTSRKNAVPCCDYIMDGRIEISDISSRRSYYDSGKGKIAVLIINEIFGSYRSSGLLPHKVYVDCPAV